MASIHRVPVALFVIAAAFVASADVRAAAPSTSTCRLEVLVDGRAVPEYPALGTRYVEAVKGRNYELRIHNPFDVRVAVALSVDGLNTIDARRTSAATARKWVIGPHETITISGWQVSMAQARKFYFTSEEASYAQRLGQPDNIGVISAVFFRERAAVRAAPLTAGQSRDEARGPSGTGAPAPGAPAAAERNAARADKSESAAREDYAATGIGDRTAHVVSLVQLDLEERPVSVVDIRYEYRAQLVRLGVLPEPVDPLSRRQNARGFDKGFCPDIR
jgi:hypothetical protein